MVRGDHLLKASIASHCSNPLRLGRCAHILLRRHRAAIFRYTREAHCTGVEQLKTVGHALRRGAERNPSHGKATDVVNKWQVEATDQRVAIVQTQLNHSANVVDDARTDVQQQFIRKLEFAVIRLLGPEPLDC